MLAAQDHADPPVAGAERPISEERRNVTNLIRMLGLFAAVPGLSISLVFLLDLQEHLGHFLLLFPVGAAGVAAMVLAPRLAARWVAE